jgi:hypothetical protein
MATDEEAAFAASILILIEKLKPGQRLVVSNVPDASTHIQMEEIPAKKIRELQALHRRQFNH